MLRAATQEAKMTAVQGVCALLLARQMHMHSWDTTRYAHPPLLCSGRVCLFAARRSRPAVVEAPNQDRLADGHVPCASFALSSTRAKAHSAHSPLGEQQVEDGEPTGGFQFASQRQSAPSRATAGIESAAGLSPSRMSASPTQPASARTATERPHSMRPGEPSSGRPNTSHGRSQQHAGAASSPTAMGAAPASPRRTTPSRASPAASHANDAEPPSRGSSDEADFLHRGSFAPTCSSVDDMDMETVMRLVDAEWLEAVYGNGSIYGSSPGYGGGGGGCGGGASRAVETRNPAALRAIALSLEALTERLVGQLTPL
eukprot:6494982-Prymnesium_polylepis.1